MLTLLVPLGALLVLVYICVMDLIVRHFDDDSEVVYRDVPQDWRPRTGVYAPRAHV